VLAQVELRFGRDERIASQGEGALLLAPFHRLDVEHDDPDTLLAAYALQLRAVQHLPRNDVAPTLLGSLLRSGGYEVLSLRAALPLPVGWNAEWPSAPPLRIWVLPDAETLPPAQAWCDEVVQFGVHGVVLSDRWPLRESLRAQDLLQILTRMQAGESVGAAFWSQRRELWQRGEPAWRWAGWTLLGDPDYELQSAAPNRLQRWLRVRRAHRLGLEPDSAGE
jgi:hypothetical protein